jgi:hypothetical protein
MNIPTWITVVLPIFTLLLGGFFQHCLTRAAKENERITDLRVKAYCDFIAATAREIYMRQAGMDTLAVRTERHDARNRVCIFGSDEVIKALAVYERQGVNEPRANKQNYYLCLCQAMRADMNPGRSTDDRSLRMAMFGRIAENVDPTPE